MLFINLILNIISIKQVTLTYLINVLKIEFYSKYRDKKTIKIITSYFIYPWKK